MISIRSRIAYPPPPFDPSQFGVPFTFLPIRATSWAYRRAGQQPVKLQAIKEAVADFYEIDVADLDAATRFRHIARPRQVAMWLARLLTRLSLPQIGRYFGGRDHTTVMHAVRTIDRLLERDELLQDDVAIIRSALGSKFHRATLSAVPSFLSADQLAGR